LPRIRRKAQSNPATASYDPPDLSQACASIRPELHGIDRHRFIEGVVRERQARRRAEPQVNATAFDCLGVPSRRLCDHFDGRIDSRDCDGPGGLDSFRGE
jgi:hypothetical protein